MSWICVSCSARHMDNIRTMGFGLCNTCQIKKKEDKAKKKINAFAKRGIGYKKTN